MSVRHTFLERRATTGGTKTPVQSPIVAQDRPAVSRDESRLFLDHTAANITRETNDLIDAAIAASFDDAERILHTAMLLRARIDAVADRALQRMNELTK